MNAIYRVFTVLSVLLVGLSSMVLSYSSIYNTQLNNAQYYYSHEEEYLLTYYQPDHSRYEQHTYNYDSYDTPKRQSGYIRNPSSHTRNVNYNPDYRRYSRYTYEFHPYRGWHHEY